MCSAKDICALLKGKKKISLVWGGNIHSFDASDKMQVGAYGDYAVDEIEVYTEDEVGIVVAFTPIKVT